MKQAPNTQRRRRFYGGDVRRVPPTWRYATLNHYGQVQRAPNNTVKVVGEHTKRLARRQGPTTRNSGFRGGA
jgi:predicted FMN-binding regulatory protein PaiB